MGRCGGENTGRIPWVEDADSDDQQCPVSGYVRGLEGGKIHGILGATGQDSRVSGDLSEKMSAT